MPPKIIKVLGPEKLLVVDVKFSEGKGFVVQSVKHVDEIPAKGLGINQVNDTARVAVRVSPTGGLSTIGLDKVAKAANIAKEGRCTM